MAVKLQARPVWSAPQLLSLITETAKAMPEAGTEGRLHVLNLQLIIYPNHRKEGREGGRTHLSPVSKKHTSPSRIDKLILTQRKGMKKRCSNQMGPRHKPFSDKEDFKSKQIKKKQGKTLYIE